MGKFDDLIEAYKADIAKILDPEPRRVQQPPRRSAPGNRPHGIVLDETARFNGAHVHSDGSARRAR